LGELYAKLSERSPEKTEFVLCGKHGEVVLGVEGEQYFLEYQGKYFDAPSTCALYLQSGTARTVSGPGYFSYNGEFLTHILKTAGSRGARPRTSTSRSPDPKRPRANRFLGKAEFTKSALTDCRIN
jgi:hypothetical protein